VLCGIIPLTLKLITGVVGGTSTGFSSGLGSGLQESIEIQSNPTRSQLFFII
jgi:hypothetical protein